MTRQVCPDGQGELWEQAMQPALPLDPLEPDPLLVLAVLAATEPVDPPALVEAAVPDAVVGVVVAPLVLPEDAPPLLPALEAAVPFDVDPVKAWPDDPFEPLTEPALLPEIVPVVLLVFAPPEQANRVIAANTLHRCMVPPRDAGA